MALGHRKTSCSRLCFMISKLCTERQKQWNPSSLNDYSECHSPSGSAATQKYKTAERKQSVSSTWNFMVQLVMWMLTLCSRRCEEVCQNQLPSACTLSCGAALAKRRVQLASPVLRYARPLFSWLHSSFLASICATSFHPSKYVHSWHIKCSWSTLGWWPITK